MMIEFNSRHEKSLVLLDSPQGDVICNLSPENCSCGGYRHFNYFGLVYYDEDLTEKSGNVTGDISKVYGLYGNLLWERTPEQTYNLDGVEYSESTLRSLIKKATDS